jgi:hypothetical protein
MTIYRPFLTATDAEVAAALATDGIGTAIQPVWELTPTQAEPADLVRRLAAAPRPVPWRIDAHRLRHGQRSHVTAIDAACRAGKVAYVPVMSPTSSTRDRAAAATAAAHHRRGVVWRMPLPQGPAEVDAAAAAVRALGLRPAQADLVLDCGYLAHEFDAARTAGALLIPIYRALCQRWRSVTALSGAFPAMPTSGPVPRHDAAMFRQLPFAVDFGDFGVAHPAPAVADHSPGLALNRGDDWVVYGPHEVDGLNASAGGGTAAPRAPRPVVRPAPTAPAEWGQWSTAHHLAMVRHRLDRNAA